MAVGHDPTRRNLQTNVLGVCLRMLKARIDIIGATVTFCLIVHGMITVCDVFSSSSSNIRLQWRVSVIEAGDFFFIIIVLLELVMT